MSRVRLSRLPGERARVAEDGTTHEVALAELSDRFAIIARGDALT